MDQQLMVRRTWGVELGPGSSVTSTLEGTDGHGSAAPGTLSATCDHARVHGQAGLDAEPQIARAKRWQDPGRPGSGRAAGAPPRATLLLVDDEEILRTALVRTLTFDGYRVLCAVDGTDAERVFREHATEIDVVLLDANMPHRDGEATFHVLRALRPSLPVVLMSGLPEEHTIRLKDAGLSGFLCKPFRMSEMRDALRVALGEQV